MKSCVAVLPLSLVMVVVGCASPSHPLVLAPVGPAQPGLSQPETGGTLLVYSALSRRESDYQEDLDAYSDYKLFTGAGQFLMKVHNIAPGGGAPAKVSLPPGSYRVLARANGYGQVTVPVVIEAHRTTTVHLEGDNGWNPGLAGAANAPVRLPDGQIVGWSAQPSAVPSSVMAGSGTGSGLKGDAAKAQATN